MGEVYRAHDTQLKRDVAIKVLPDPVSEDPDRLARFQREAELLAVLNHPNIAAVYGLAEADGVTAIVLELVEGETLAERIDASRATGSGLAVSEALDIAKQIADALEAAHEKGVIHRDLKPANIKITNDGTTKVLDFGLAKMLEPPVRSPVLTMSPTYGVHATHAGVILGTAAYMSPEQARGKPVDRRTDVWSFGCVLFEMLTGARPFDAGETVSDAIASILTREPDLNTLPPDTPPNIRVLLRRCLQKDPKRRLPHIGVARLEIEETATSASMAAPPVPAAATTGTLLRLAWACAGVAAVVAAVLAAIMLQHREPDALGAVRFAIEPPAGLRIGSNVAQRGPGTPAAHFAPSPDASRIAYVMHGDSEAPRLWVRRLDGNEAQAVAGTDEASFPFWSPDSAVIAFFAQAKLKKIAVSGGAAHTICDAAAGEGGTWNRTGDIVFAPGEGTGLLKVSASGGIPTAVTTLDTASGETAHSWPQFLPDDRHFLYLARLRQPRGTTGPGDQSRFAVYVASLDSTDRALILSDAPRAQYAAGHLLFVRDGTLMAQRFDVASLRLTGAPTSVAEQVATNVGNGRTGFAASQHLLTYRSVATQDIGNVLSWFDRTGRRLESIGGRSPYATVRLSPDGKALAAHITHISTSAANVLTAPGDLWTFDLTRGGIPSRLTATPEEREDGLVWYPDGSRIAFAAAKGGGPTTVLMQQPSNGVGDAEVLLDSPETKRPWSWSPDGRYIAFYQVSPKTLGDIWLLPLFGDRKPSPFVQTEFNEGIPMFSPDGRWIAYQSDEAGGSAPGRAGISDIYVRSFPSGDRKIRISQSSGSYPQWRADGKELFYFDAAGRALFAVPIKTEPTFEAGLPRKLFDAPARSGPAIGQYSITPDGSRILMIETGESVRAPADAPIMVVVNWAERLAGQ